MKFGISTKLYLGFGIIMLVFLALLSFGLTASFKDSAEFEKLYVNTVRSAIQLASVQNALWQLRYGVSQFMTADPAGQTKITAEEQKWHLAITENLAAYEQGNRTDAEKAALRELKENYAKYIQARPKWFELYGADKKDEAAQWRAQTIFPFGGAMVKSLSKQVELQQLVADESLKKATKSQRNTKMVLLGLVGCTVLFGILYSYIFSNRFCAPIKQNLDVLNLISGGDLTRRFETTSRDELGTLVSAFNSFITKMNTLLSQVSEGSEQLSRASKQLNLTSEQMLSEITEVATQSFAVATASEEMAATSGEIAHNCQSVASSSEQASTTAVSGKAVVETTVAVMSRIASEVQGSARTVEKLGVRSNEIGEIIATIEDIADQTNLLALNAAIEAARAGEQGRGFAVVADEVRALAERTTRATREIGGMIKSIQNETNEAVTSMEQGVREVEQGTVEARKSGDALQEILDQVNAVAIQANQIATAAEEQTATTAEISNNIHQITTTVQKTTQGAQNTAGASGELARLAEQLRSLVNQFRLV
ncbi:MAG: hypothetical protein A2076_16650 [Geobacteraceae bacterium GWC2_53_11]|nr:MAG: hypothetical protein A2076_16650 [Geobacteraceae bacterium GWC2_53_11]